MRWACVLTAQVFSEWPKDMQNSGMSDLSSEDRLSEQRSRFQRGLLFAAALHMQSSMEEEGSAVGVSGHSLLDFGVWNKYPKLCNGVFSLQEFLRGACESGTGLPFGEPRRKASSGGQDSVYSYSKFQSKLYRIREMFRVGDVERQEQFDTCHLEWLAVLLSVPDWRPKTGSTESVNQDDRNNKTPPLNSTSFAVDDLRSQLGLSNPSSKSGLRLLNYFF